jgi:hypothetical protein
MKAMIIKTMWFCSGGVTCMLGLSMDTDVLLKIIVTLCGLLTVLFSLTFGTILKHISNHNQEKYEILKEFRTVKECEALHRSILDVVNVKLEAMAEGIAAIAATSTKSAPEEPVSGLDG